MRLTGRSIALVVAAGVSLGLAVIAGVPALIPVVGLCVGLVAIAVLTAWMARPRVEARRTIEPAVLEPDESARVRLDLTIRSTLSLVVGHWRDRVPGALAGTATGTVPVTDQSAPRLAYDLHSGRRGRHEIGPLTVVVGDAFGLVERAVVVPGRDHLIVLPRRRSLDARVGSGGTTDGAAQLHPTSGLGQDDVIARPHLPGDALKRWHWKATAHRGEPMVRQEESELRPTVLVVLDADPRVHDQAGFEWSVSAAASVVCHYGERGFDLDLVTGSSVVSLESGHGMRDALVSLALAEPTSEPVHLPARERTTFVFTGSLDSAAAQRLVASVPSRDTIAFIARGTSDAAAETLDRAGWHLVVRDAGDDLAAIWTDPTRVTVP